MKEIGRNRQKQSENDRDTNIARLRDSSRVIERQRQRQTQREDRKAEI